MNDKIEVIPRDSYADNLLLNLVELKPGMNIKRDAFADELLYNSKRHNALKVLPDEKVAPENRNVTLK